MFDARADVSIGFLLTDFLWERSEILFECATILSCFTLLDDEWDELWDLTDTCVMTSC